MKRILTLFFILMMTLMLFGCGRQEQTPNAPDEPDVPPEETGITLAELNVEFVADGRDANALMQLKRELPPLLIGALAEHEISVEKVNVTFGASNEATAEALARGTVQVAFVPTETYLAHADALLVTDVSLSPEIIAFGTTQSEYGLTLREKAGDWSWDELAQAVWALPQDENSFSMRWLNAYLDKVYEGRTAADLPNVLRYSADGAMDDAVFDLYVAKNAEPFVAGYISGAELYPYFFSSVTVVSAADDILSADTFLTALGEAVNALSADEESALYAYNGTRYGYVEQDTLEAAFEGWQLVYDFEHAE